jgi:hypothetical protein
LSHPESPARQLVGIDLRLFKGVVAAGIGAAIGPAAVGRLIEANGYGSLGILMIVSSIFAGVLLGPVLLKPDCGGLRSPMPISAP